jgi:hypothetical protein
MAHSGRTPRPISEPAPGVSGGALAGSLVWLISPRMMAAVIGTGIALPTHRSFARSSRDDPVVGERVPAASKSNIAELSPRPGP